MINAKRGLSDVVTTVLIILLALAAITIVWSFVGSTVENVGESTGQAQCLTARVEPTGCDAGTNAAYASWVSGEGVDEITVIVEDPATGQRDVFTGAATSPGASVGQTGTWSITAGDIVRAAFTLDHDGDAGTPSIACPESTVTKTCA